MSQPLPPPLSDLVKRFLAAYDKGTRRDVAEALAALRAALDREG